MQTTRSVHRSYISGWNPVHSSRRTCTRKPPRCSAFWMVTLLTKTRRMVQGIFCILNQALSMVPTRQKRLFTSSLVYSEHGRGGSERLLSCRGGKAQLKLSDCRSEHERQTRYTGMAPESYRAWLRAPAELSLFLHQGGDR